MPLSPPSEFTSQSKFTLTPPNRSQEQAPKKSETFTYRKENEIYTQAKSLVEALLSKEICGGNPTDEIKPTKPCPGICCFNTEAYEKLSETDKIKVQITAKKILQTKSASLGKDLPVLSDSLIDNAMTYLDQKVESNKLNAEVKNIIGAS